MPDQDRPRPTIALAMGDPAGISPELTAKLLVNPDVLAAADLVVFGDARVLAEGAAVAGVAPDLEIGSSVEGVQPGGKPILVDGEHLDPATITRGVAAKAGGAFALANYRAALDFAAEGRAGAVCFTPFNKAAMKLADPEYGDEIVYTSARLGFQGAASEFNILGSLWNARVTSHVPLSGVAAAITGESVLRGIRLTDASLRKAGVSAPRIAVAALNPHAGEDGNFGREEIDVIAPAIARARSEQIRVEGPVPV